jgi:hypothetical protein
MIQLLFSGNYFQNIRLERARAVTQITGFLSARTPSTALSGRILPYLREVPSRFFCFFIRRFAVASVLQLFCHLFLHD